MPTRGELSPEGLRYLLTRTRSDLCPVRTLPDGTETRDLKPAAVNWLAERVFVHPNTIMGWINRGQFFDSARQSACLVACAEYALLHRMPLERNSALTGRRALVVEDEAIVAMVIERDLRDLGCDVPDLCLTFAAAMAAAEAGGWDFAVVDLNLHGELSWPVVEVLYRQHVPVVLTTAYTSRAASEPPIINPAPPRLIKPYDPTILTGALLALVAT